MDVQNPPEKLDELDQIGLTLAEDCLHALPQVQEIRVQYVTGGTVSLTVQERGQPPREPIICVQGLSD